MIVNCPSCTTLYRYEPPPGLKAVPARCSGCSTEFEMEPFRRAYAVFAEVPVAGSPGTVRGEAEPWTPPDGMDLGAFDYGSEAAAGEAKPGAGKASRKAALGEWFTTLFLGSVGAGSGYYLSLVQETDLTTFVAGGSAIGLVLGWAVIRWMAREP